MKQFFFILFLLLSINTFVSSQIASSIFYLDRFNSYKNGSEAEPAWHPVKGSWQVINSQYIQQASDYDCASMYGSYLTESYEIEVTFQNLDGDLGAGLIFSSYQRNNTAYAHMIRFEGAGILLIGYFQNSEFTATASLKVDSLDIKLPHTLLLKIDRDNDNFTILLDGKTIRSGEPLIYRSGYCGLESSAGKHAFHKFRLTRKEIKKPINDFPWIRKLAVTADNKIIIPDENSGRIKILSVNDSVVGFIGSPASEGGQLQQPSGITIVNQNTVAVTDKGTNKLHLFSINGDWKASTGWKGTEKGLFDEPVAVVSNKQGQIFVLEKNNHRVQVLSDSLKPISEFGKDILKSPLDLAIEKNDVYVVNTGLCQVEHFSWDGTKAEYKGFISFGGGECRGIAVQNGNLYLSIVSEVREYDTTGTLLKTFTGRACNFLTPAGIAIDNSGTVYIADFAGGRIIKTSPALADPTPSVRFTETSAATIEWIGSKKTIGQVLVLNGSDTVGIYKESKASFQHSVKIEKLNTSTSYHYRLFPSGDIIPATQSFSRTYPLRTPPGNHQKQYSRLPMLTIIFANVIDDKSTITTEMQPKLPDKDIERIQSQIRDGIKFYWIHSSFNFFIDNEFLVIHEPVKRSQLYGTEWWYPPLDSAIENNLNRNGKNIKDYSSIIYLTCVQQFDTTLKKYTLAGKGGAFTNGVGTGKGYGISWWEVTKENHNAGNNWLFVHEFNHQLDDIFMVSGYPEYWFNHISPTIGTAANFGEHFDANRHILRIVPNDEWLDLQFTDIQTTADQDDDGIPDNDPSLPLDEARLGSSPKARDTDGDGISDLQEIAASNWISEGWGETYSEHALFPNLQSADTDSDGVTDGEDPFPCFPFISDIHQTTDTPDDWQEIGELHDSKINAVVNAGWDETNLYIECKTDQPVPLKIMIDADGDGWFLGRGNFLLTVKPGNSNSLDKKLQIFNATDHTKWPFMDDSLAAGYNPIVTFVKDGDQYKTKIIFPRNNFLGLNYSSGKIIGILTGFLCSFDSDNNKRYVNLFEPNRFVDLTLRK